jgi:hypothetical protein
MDERMSALEEEAEVKSDAAPKDILSPEDEDDSDPVHESTISRLPLILPRIRYTGACNVETVKDGECQSTQMNNQI